MQSKPLKQYALADHSTTWSNLTRTYF